ncbi:MAG: hypothetical protein AB1422_07015 [bacterium]
MGWWIASSSAEIAAGSAMLPRAMTPFPRIVSIPAHLANEGITLR